MYLARHLESKLLARHVGVLQFRLVVAYRASMTRSDCNIEELRRIDRANLEVGVPLGGCLRDRNGRVLVRPGYVLSEADVERMRAIAPDGFFAGPDWPDAPVIADDSPPAVSNTVPEELIEAIRKLRQTPTAKSIRQHERHGWQASLVIELQETSEAGVSRRTVPVEACDVSAGGFAFKYQGYVNPGTQAVAQFDALPGRPRMGRIVRSCVHLTGRTHRVGVQFTRATHPGDPTKGNSGGK